MEWMHLKRLNFQSLKAAIHKIFDFFTYFILLSIIRHNLHYIDF